MKRSSLFIAFTVVLCLAGTALWWAYAGNTPQPTIPVAKATIKPAPPSAPAPSPAPQPTVAATPSPPPEPPQAVSAAPRILTADTIKGTKWKGDMVDFNFLPDGRWQMGNRICAKWSVEGGRVRVYSDSGEEHFFDIQGEYLAFEGQKLSKLP